MEKIKYLVLLEELGKKISNFPIFWAFDIEQIDEGKKKIGILENIDLCTNGSGGYFAKTKKEEYEKLFSDHREEVEKLFQDPEQFRLALMYELGNHDVYESTKRFFDL